MSKKKKNKKTNRLFTYPVGEYLGKLEDTLMNVVNQFDEDRESDSLAWEDSGYSWVLFGHLLIRLGYEVVTNVLECDDDYVHTLCSSQVPWDLPDRLVPKLKKET